MEELSLVEATDASERLTEVRNPVKPEVGCTSRRCQIAPLVYMCATRQGVVILDLKRNRYLSVDCGEALSLSEHVDSFPKKDSWLAPGQQASSKVTRDQTLIRSLLDEGIIVKDRCCTSDELRSADVSIDGALVSVGHELVAATPVHAKHVMVFLIILVSSWFDLRFRPLLTLARRARQSRVRALENGYKFNLQRAVQIVSVFRSIRPYIFMAEGNCLLHALTLVRFLGYYGEFPNWIFGVSSDPWTAHTWIQQDVFLLDSNPEAVCSLDVILAI